MQSFIIFRNIVHKNSQISNNYFIPCPGNDKSVVDRTQKFMLEYDEKRPIQIQTYLGVKNIFYLFFTFIFGVICIYISKYKFGRYLLLNYPRITTFGIVSCGDIKEAKMNGQKFKFTLIGEGWPKDQVDQLSGKQIKFSEATSKKMIVEVSGTNPLGRTTCICLLVAAKTVARQAGSMYGQGGVMTAGAAFPKTFLIEQLMNFNALTFEVKQEL